MKNLQVIDILNSIIDGFNKQLEQANKSVYKGVDTNIRRNETFGAAPFNRREGENIWDIRVCVESNLTGDKYKTRRFTDYNNYINSTVYFQPIKGLDGTTIDFTQAHTYSNLDGDDLETYVGLESEWLGRKIEGVFGTDGTFSTHQQTEYTRLGDAFGQYYGDWMAGEALQNGAFYSKPIVSGAPSLLTSYVMAGQIVGTATGQVWIGAAVNASAVAIQVADGSLSWKHAGTQFSVGAASAMTNGVSDIAASGITYDEDGGVGWSKSQFKEGAKKNVVKAGLKSVGMDTFTTETIMSGLETGGDWNHFGFDTENWKQHLVVGAAAALNEGAGQASGSSLLGQFLSQSLQVLAYDVFDGKGFSDDYGQQYSNFNWNTFGPSASSLGSYIGWKAGDLLSKRLDSMSESHKERGTKGLPNGSGFLDYAEDMLGGLWQGAKDAKKWITDISESIKNTALDRTKDFAQRTGNLFTEGHFASDEELPEILAQERLQEALRNGTALQEGSAEYNRMKSVVNAKISNGSDSDSQARADEKLASYKNNKDVDSSLKNLTDLAQQNGGGSEYVCEELKKALSKIPGGDKLNIDKIIETSCVSLSVWVALKQAGANVGEYGEFYAEQVKKGNISAENASVNKIHNLANSYKIDGKKPEVGFIRDFNKYEKLLNSGEVSNGVVLFERSKEKYHAINVYASNEDIKISDVSYRPHGKLASGIVDKDNYRWLFYVKKRGK